MPVPGAVRDSRGPEDLGPASTGPRSPSGATRGPRDLAASPNLEKDLVNGGPAYAFTSGPTGERARMCVQQVSQVAGCADGEDAKNASTAAPCEPSVGWIRRIIGRLVR